MLKDTDKMPWGTEHRNKPLIEVPADYLIWAHENKWRYLPQDLRDYIKNNWDVLKSQAKQKK